MLRIEKQLIPIDDYFIYNTQNYILICCQHSYTIAPDNITLHFRKFHKETLLETCNEISSYVKTLELWMPEEVITRHNGLFIDELTVTTGFQCQYQGYQELCGLETSMEKHCHKARYWVVAQGIK